MLEVDADKRITAEETLAHPYLAEVYTYSSQITLFSSLFPLRPIWVSRLKRYFIFNLFFSPICLLIFHVYHQYADPTDEPNSQVYDQTFEDYELSIQDWKGENNQILFNKNT